MSPLLLLAEQRVDVSAHADLVTNLLLGVCAGLVAFFAIRPELWRRLFFDRVDPRPAGLLRIFFGLVVLWTWLDLLPLSRVLFTDEGMWLTDMARKNYGGRLKTDWDPVHGFETIWGPIQALWSRGSFLHLRSDPPFVFTMYGLMLAAITCMVLGIKTRVATVVVYLLVESFYRYSPIFYTGGDTVSRVFLFMGMFCRWGEAYSLDTLWRRKRAIRDGARQIPALRRIAAWPQRLMMLQLTIIYFATGVLKSGVTWMDGTALYYALNLDHFYRFPMTGLVAWLQYIGALPLQTHLVHLWEVLFPLALVGLAINAYERERRAGTWVGAATWRRWASWAVFAGVWAVLTYVAGLSAGYYLQPRYLPFPARPAQIAMTVTWIVALTPPVCIGLYLVLRSRAPRAFDFIRCWLLGKRLWLVLGVGLHVGIDLSMNVGTFAQVMMSVYFAWLSGPEVASGWRWLMARAARPGEGGRPVRRGWPGRLLAISDRLLFRVPAPGYTIRHAPDEASVRRAAMLRLYDPGERLRFEPDTALTPEVVALEVEGEPGRITGPAVGSHLTRVLPAFWWLRPVSRLPAAGQLVLWATR